ncbi:MAG: addiction module protein [Gemmatimonadota bacterium]
MTKTLAELFRLPVAERAEIAAALWESVAGSPESTGLPLTPEQRAELERRLAEHERDPDSALDWEIVRRRLLHEV